MGICGCGPLTGAILLPFHLINVAWAKPAKVMMVTYSLCLILKEADLVTTHELGHNFGAEHDPDGLAECAPSEDQGGKYVMYPIAVSGDHENNKVCVL